MPQVNGRNLYLNDGADAGRKLWEEKRALERAELRANLKALRAQIQSPIQSARELAVAIDTLERGELIGYVRISESRYQMGDFWLRIDQSKIAKVDARAVAGGCIAGWLSLYCRCYLANDSKMRKWMRANRLTPANKPRVKR